MKKTLISIVILAALTITAAAIFYISKSPEYALYKIYKQVKEDGIEGVENNLTEEAHAKLEPFFDIVNNDLFGLVGAFFATGEDTMALIEKVKEIEWSVEDVEKSKNKACFRIGFDYEGEFVGTIDLELEKEESIWKISKLHNLQLERVGIV